MKMIKEAWNNTPNAVKKGLFVVGCLVVGAAVKVAVHAGVNEYKSRNEETVTDVTEESVIIVKEDVEAVVVVD